MQIAKNHVVKMHYTLTSPSGEVIDTSSGREPLAYLHGHGNIIPGLESQLEGKVAGDKIIANIAAKDGYGDHDPAMIVDASRDQFPAEAELKAGVTFQADTPQGPRIVKIHAVDGEKVQVDTNHPLAGVDLKFDVEIVEVREADATEIDHGHVH